MDSQKKHYIITAITLGLIAASSAVLIGVTNLITAKKIEQNEVMKIICFGGDPNGNEREDTAYTVNESFEAYIWWS